MVASDHGALLGSSTLTSLQAAHCRCLRRPGPRVGYSHTSNRIIMNDPKTVEQHEKEQHNETPVTWETVGAIVGGLCIVIFIMLIGYVIGGWIFDEPTSPHVTQELYTIKCNDGRNLLVFEDLTDVDVFKWCNAKTYFDSYKLNVTTSTPTSL